MSEVRFTALSDGTRVDLEHRGWEDLGEAAEKIRPLYSSESGWTMVLGATRSSPARSRAESPEIQFSSS